MQLGFFMGLAHVGASAREACVFMPAAMHAVFSPPCRHNEFSRAWRSLGKSTGRMVPTSVPNQHKQERAGKAPQQQQPKDKVGTIL